jgi:hypothetical protein
MGCRQWLPLSVVQLKGQKVLPQFRFLEALLVRKRTASLKFFDTIFDIFFDGTSFVEITNDKKNFTRGK